MKYNTLIYQLSWQLGKLATTKCNPQFLDSLWRRAKAQNVTFQFLYSVQFTLSTDLTNPHFCASLPHWQTNHSSFLETNPFVWLCWCDSAWHEFSLVMGVITWHWVRYEKCSVITGVWNRSNSDQHEFRTDPIEIFVSSYEYAWYCKFENLIQVVQPQTVIIFLTNGPWWYDNYKIVSVNSFMLVEPDHTNMNFNFPTTFMLSIWALSLYWSYVIIIVTYRAGRGTVPTTARVCGPASLRIDEWFVTFEDCLIHPWKIWSQFLWVMDIEWSEPIVSVFHIW